MRNYIRKLVLWFIVDDLKNLNAAFADSAKAIEELTVKVKELQSSVAIIAPAMEHALLQPKAPNDGLIELLTEQENAILMAISSVESSKAVGRREIGRKAATLDTLQRELEKVRNDKDANT